jgi:hypothetical protein
MYWREVNTVAASLAEEVFLASLATPDGGKAGRTSLVGRDVAARFIVEGRARLANDEEIARFHVESARAKRTIEAQESSHRGNSVRRFVNWPPGN